MNKRKIFTMILLFFSILFSYGNDEINFTRDLFVTKPRLNGEDIKYLQEFLIEIGFDSIGDADGWYGPLTEEAVKELEVYFGFEQDGVVDNSLWSALFGERELSEKWGRESLFDTIYMINRLEQNKLNIKLKPHSLYHDSVNMEVYQLDGAIIKIIEHDKYEYGFTDYIYYFFPGVIFMIDKKIPFDDTDPLYNVYINKVFNYRIKEEKFIEEKWKLSEILSVLNNEIVEDIFKKYSIDYEL